MKVKIPEVGYFEGNSFIKNFTAEPFSSLRNNGAH